jgi:hypothetical protein
MLLNLQGNVEKKMRAREMKADFNPYSVEQREHEEMMIKVKMMMIVDTRRRATAPAFLFI